MTTLAQTLDKVSKNCDMIDVVARLQTDFTAMDCAREYYLMFGETIDWHEFSSWSDMQRNEGFLKLDRINSSGMCVYSLNF